MPEYTIDRNDEDAESLDELLDENEEIVESDYRGSIHYVRTEVEEGNTDTEGSSDEDSEDEE